MRLFNLFYEVFFIFKRKLDIKLKQSYYEKSWSWIGFRNVLQL